MTIKTPTKQDTFTISYQRQEAKKVIGMEYELMEHFGFNRSQLHKSLVRDAYRQLRMFWALRGLSMKVHTNTRVENEANKNWWCPLLNAQGHWQEMENVSWGLSSRTDSRDLFQQKEKRIGIFCLGPFNLQRQPNPREIKNLFSQKNPLGFLGSQGDRQSSSIVPAMQCCCRFKGRFNLLDKTFVL